MMVDINIHDFDREVGCSYEGDRYLVRDNGSVFKHSRIGQRLRSTDNQWTFGKPNDRTGYMEIASVRVHRIVATAFYGIPPTKEHVVDHIDTNKKNNRPENLRCVTRFENVLLNPITIKRIEFACGCSVEEFLADPSRFRDMFLEPNYKWMCTVSKEDAQASLERMLKWVKSDEAPSGGSLGEWIYNRSTLKDRQVEKTSTSFEISEESYTIMAKTVNAVQRNWRVPSEFPCCPREFSEAPIKAYSSNLKTGTVFCRNEYYHSTVFKSGMVDNNQVIYVITQSSNTTPRALAKITYESGHFVHTSLGSYFSKEGVEKYFCLEQGLEWADGDTFDDLI